MGKRSSFYLKQTDIKASKGFDKFLSGHLVKATRIENQNLFHYGIVIPFEKIEKELSKKQNSKNGFWEDQIWAIWCHSQDAAIKSYENVNDNQFTPKSEKGGLEYLSPRDYEFAIID